MIHVLCGTAIDCLSSYDNNVDLIVTDPPYGIGYDIGGQPTTAERLNQVQWSPIVGDDKVDGSWLPYAYKALRPGAALYMCCRWDVEPVWRQQAQQAGFLVKQRLTWHKRVHGKGDLKGTWATTCEDVLMLTKGRHILNSRPSMLLDAGCVPTWEMRYHPHQKPVCLFDILIQTSSQPGDLVVDPFLGSGSSGVSAKQLGRRFVGCEIDQQIAEQAAARIGVTE